MHVVQVLHAALVVEGGGDHAQAAEHARLAEARDQPVDVAQAVEQREDDGVGSDGGRERIHGGVEVVGLAADHDHVVRAADLLGQHVLRRGQVEVAEGAAHHEPGRGQLGRAAGTQ
ncbi:hypothetical protein D3C72_2166010 [compost metagenome]